MFLVGLTGGIASGKSEVGERFVMAGAELVDADEIAREVTLPGEEPYRKVVEHFGTEILDEDGFIDRAALGGIIFADPGRRAVLNELTHPPVVARIADYLELLTAFDGLVVLDVPLLVEAGMEDGFEAIVVVACDPETQVRRLVERRGATEAAARARLAAQAPLDDKIAVATHVIWNDGTLVELYEQADTVAAELAARAREKAEAQAAELPDD
ncbi:MAG: dephospho-CoA kinase [Egibacteraceae bacterium]